MIGLISSQAKDLHEVQSGQLRPQRGKYFGQFKHRDKITSFAMTAIASSMPLGPYTGYARLSQATSCNQFDKSKYWWPCAF